MHSKLDDTETTDVKFQIDDEVIRHILDKLDKVQEKQPFERSHPRIQFRRCGVLVKIEHIGGTRARLRVWTRNISAGGISLVHGSFVHPGSRCEVTVPQRNGEMQEVRGVVRWCRLLSGILHEIGVQFEEEQNMELFVNVALLRDDRPDLAATQSTAPARLDLVKAADTLMQEIDQLIEPPNLKRAKELCRRMQQIASQLDFQELDAIAGQALQSLNRTDSIARSEMLLRQVQGLAKTLHKYRE